MEKMETLEAKMTNGQLWPIEKRQPEDLKRHPFHEATYSSNRDETLVESIVKHGLKIEPWINSKNEILRGYQTVLICIELGITDIDVKVVDIPTEEEPELIIQGNAHQKKSIRTIINEIDELSKKWNTQGKRNDLNPSFSGDEMKLDMRQKIARRLKIPSGHVQKIKYLIANAPHLLNLIDQNEMTINEAYIKSKPAKVEDKKILPVADPEITSDKIESTLDLISTDPDESNTDHTTLDLNVTSEEPAIPAFRFEHICPHCTRGFN